MTIMHPAPIRDTITLTVVEHAPYRDDRSWNVKCAGCNMEMTPGLLAGVCVSGAVREAAYQAARDAGGDHYTGLMAWYAAGDRPESGQS
jgi:hypothetical protein